MPWGIYLRQSKDTLGTGLAVGRQREDCIRLCQARGYEIEEFYVDNDVSASTKKPRPHYQRMLTDIRAGRLEGVVCWDLDRLTRKPIEMEEFIDLADRYGIQLASVSGEYKLDTPEGRLFARLRGVVARQEMEQKSLRQRRAGQQRAERGMPSGGKRPFGYHDDRTINEVEAAAIKDAYRLFLAGASLKSIAAQLNAQGFTTTYGNRWESTALRKFLLNPRSAALRFYHGQYVGKATWAPIIAEETWRAACAIITSPERRHAPGHGARKYLLSGLLRCGKCGAAMGVGWRGSIERGVRLCYRCNSHDGYLARAAAPIDELVTRTILTYLSRPQAARLLIDEEKPDIEALRAKKKILEEKMAALASELADSESTMTLPQFNLANRTMRETLDEINKQMSHVDRRPVLGPLIEADDLEETWNTYTLDRRRAIIDTLVEIYAHPAPRGRPIFNPKTIEFVWKLDTALGLPSPSEGAE